MDLSIERCFERLLQITGTYILLPGKPRKYNAWTKTNGTNYQNKNTKGEKEGQTTTTIIIITIINNNENDKKEA